MSEPSQRRLDALPVGLALATLAGLAAVWTLQPIVHDDVFWHVRTGESIALHLEVPHRDTFSFTRPGAPWITHEWGFAVLVAAAHRVGDLTGLQILAVLLVLAIGWAVWKRSPRRDAAGRLSTAFGLGLGLLAVPSLLFLRPALVGELLLALALLTADRYRDTRRDAWLVVLILLFWVWANVHSGVIFGIFVLGLQAVEHLAAGRWTMPRTTLPRLRFPAAVLAAAAICLANPNGLEALRFPFLLNRIFFHSGIAWDLGQFRSHSPLTNAALMLLAAALILGILRARPAARPRPWEIVAILVFFALSLRASRFVFSLVILMIPPAARLWAAIAASWSPARLRVVLGAGAVALVVAAALAGAPLAWPPRALDRSLPVGAARFLQEHELRGHLFHHANHGGYLYYATGQPIFWDGRNDVFWTLTREVTTTDFPILVERYGVDILVLTEREYGDLQAIVETPRWGLVYWDDAAAIYLRRDRFAARLAELELEHFRGFGGGTEELRALAATPESSDAARRELRALLAVWPENQRALYFLGVLSHYAGERAEAVDSLRRAIALGSNDLLERTLAVVEAAPL